MRESFSEDEEDEVLFLHQGNDERENLPWRREKKEDYLSPNMRIRRKYKKNDQKSRKIPADRSRNPGGAGREKRAFRRRHETAGTTAMKKARYSREGCTKEEAEALRN